MIINNINDNGSGPWGSGGGNNPWGKRPNSNGTPPDVDQMLKEGREKFKDDLANIHELFKKHVAKYRPTLDVNKVATGEVWQGIEAIDVGLVDKIQTSDSYLIEQNKKFDIFEVSFKPKKNMQDRFSRFLSFSITRTINKIFENFSKQKFM